MIVKNVAETPNPSVNSWLEDELYQQYRYDRQTVDTTWQQIFEPNGHSAAPVNGEAGKVAVAEPLPAEIMSTYGE